MSRRRLPRPHGLHEVSEAMTSMALSPSEARGRSGGHPLLREEAAPRREFDEGMRELSKSVRRRIQWERSPLNDAIDQSARDLEDALALKAGHRSVASDAGRR
jgi:hypothetical protein